MPVSQTRKGVTVLGQRIKARRRILGMYRSTVAQYCMDLYGVKIDPQLIYKIETGRTRMVMAGNLAAILSVLVFGTKERYRLYQRYGIGNGVGA